MSEQFKPISREKFNTGERRKHAEDSVHIDSLNTQYYEDALGLKMEDLKGKEILDIGGAPNGIFAQEAVDLGIKVITLNPNYSPGRPGHMNFFEFLLWEKEPVEQSRAVAGIAQQMPFKDEQFDYEIAIGSIPSYLPQFESEYKHAFGEVLRTLKPGGKMIIFPIRQHLKEDPVFKDIIKSLEKECVIEFEVPSGFNAPENEIFYRLRLTKPEFLL